MKIDDFPVLSWLREWKNKFIEITYRPVNTESLARCERCRRWRPEKDIGQDQLCQRCFEVLDDQGLLLPDNFHLQKIQEWDNHSKKSI